MKKRIQAVKKLTKIQLFYDDGSILEVPETKQLEVGTIFMKAIAKHRLEWKILQKQHPTLFERIKEFFAI